MRSEFWYEPLTPVSFLRRAASVYGDKTAVIDGERTFSYRELFGRSTQLASALTDLAGGNSVAILAPNSHMLLEAHYGVPWSGSPLLTLNIRLSAPELAWIVDHAEAAVLVYDSSLSALAHAVSEMAPRG